MKRLLFVIVLLLPSVVLANPFYVDCGAGSDGNDGLNAQTGAWASIPYAAQNATAGSTVWVRQTSGQYPAGLATFNQNSMTIMGDFEGDIWGGSGRPIWTVGDGAILGAANGSGSHFQWIEFTDPNAIKNVFDDAASGMTNWTIESCVFKLTGATTAGNIRIRNTGTFRYNVFHSATGCTYGLYVRNVGGQVIENNIFMPQPSQGILYLRGDTSRAYVRWNEFSGCSFINAYDAAQVDISNNYAHDMPGAIVSDAEANYRISNNTIVNQSDGIDVDAAVSGTQIYNNLFQGISGVAVGAGAGSVSINANYNIMSDVGTDWAFVTGYSDATECEPLLTGRSIGSGSCAYNVGTDASWILLTDIDGETMPDPPSIGCDAGQPATTPTAVPTPSVSPTPVWPAVSPPPSRTPTPTPIPTPTSAVTPSVVPTATPSCTPNNTRTPTPVPTVSPVPTRTPVPTPTIVDVKYRTRVIGANSMVWLHKYGGGLWNIGPGATGWQYNASIPDTGTFRGQVSHAGGTWWTDPQVRSSRATVLTIDYTTPSPTPTPSATPTPSPTSSPTPTPSPSPSPTPIPQLMMMHYGWIYEPKMATDKAIPQT